MTARVELRTAIIADVPVEATIRAKAAVIGGLLGDRSVIEASELAKIHSLFTADQWARLRLTPHLDLD